MPADVRPLRAAPPPAVAPLRFLRSGVVTAAVLGLALAAHTAAGGRLPPLPLLILLAALVMAPVMALSRFRLSTPMLGGILAAGQGFLHLAFNALSGAGDHCGPEGIASHGHHQAVAVPDCAMTGTAALTETAASSGFGPAAMTAAHILATALTVFVLARAEAALWQLRAWLRPLTEAPQPVRLPPTFRAPVAGTVSRPLPVPGTRITAPRGPPRPGTLLPAI